MSTGRSLAFALLSSTAALMTLLAAAYLLAGRASASAIALVVAIAAAVGSIGVARRRGRT